MISQTSSRMRRKHSAPVSYPKHVDIDIESFRRTLNERMKQMEDSDATSHPLQETPKKGSDSSATIYDDQNNTRYDSLHKIKAKAVSEKSGGHIRVFSSPRKRADSNTKSIESHEKPKEPIIRPPPLPGRKFIGDWERGKTIGEGSSGKVKIAKHKTSGEMVNCIDLASCQSSPKTKTF